MKNYLLILLLFTTGSGYAQHAQKINDYSTIKTTEWVIPKDDTLDYSQETYQNQQALLLKRKFSSGKGASVAYPRALNFKDGTIELDIASPNGEAGFMGVAFRIRDPHHYETLYFRPGASGTINAVQYMPEKKIVFNWWDYEDEKYQAKATLPMRGWFHVKLFVKGKQLTVYVNDDPTPVLVYESLDQSLKNGSVGFWLGNSPIGAYRNLVIKPL